MKVEQWNTVDVQRNNLRFPTLPHLPTSQGDVPCDVQLLGDFFDMPSADHANASGEILAFLLHFKVNSSCRFSCYLSS